MRCIWLWLRSWLAVGADSFFYKVSGQSLAWQCGFLLWFTEGLNSSLEFLRCPICLSGSLGFPACSALFKLFPVCGSTHSFILMPKPLCGHAAFSAGSPLSPVPGKKKMVPEASSTCSGLQWSYRCEIKSLGSWGFEFIWEKLSSLLRADPKTKGTSPLLPVMSVHPLIAPTSTALNNHRLKMFWERPEPVPNSSWSFCFPK